MPHTVKSPWYSINKQLIPVKGIYFFFFAGIGALLPYITVYMRQLGLSSTETGIIYGTMPFISFFVRPLFGILADKTKKHKLVLIVCTILTGILYCLLLLTPTKTDLKVNLVTKIQSSQIDSFVKDCWPVEDLGNADGKSCSQSITELGKQLGPNISNVICDFNCDIEVVSSQEMTMCFTDDIGKYSEDSCMAKWNNSHNIVSTPFIFTADLAKILANKVEGENLTYGGLTCMNYDLKNVTYNKRNYWQLLSSVETLFNCELSCPAENSKTCRNTEEHNFDQTFWIFFVTFLFCNIFFSPVIGLVDAIAYDMLGEKRGYWGFQRCWGTAGFGIFAIGSALVMYVMSPNSEVIDYSVSFYIFLGLSILSSIVTFTLKFSENIHCAQMMKNILTLLRHKRIAVFLTVITCFGIMNAVTEAFLFWYLQILGGNSITIGLCLVANCVGEITILLLAGLIIKLIGRVACLQIGLVAYAVRFFYISFITNAWYVFPAELLHCLCFGLMYAGASSYASIIAPEGTSATMQGLVGGLYFGFGKGIGSLVTGKLFDEESGLGPVWTFRFYGFFALGVLVVYSLLHFFCFRDASDPAQKKVSRDMENKNGQDGDTTAAEEMLLGTNTVNNENAEL